MHFIKKESLRAGQLRYELHKLPVRVVDAYVQIVTIQDDHCIASGQDDIDIIPLLPISLKAMADPLRKGIRFRVFRQLFST